MALIQQNFLTALAASIDNTEAFYEMRFGSGTGTAADAQTISGLFVDEYYSVMSAAGNSIESHTFNNETDVTFNVSMKLNEGNGSGTVNYTECGLFDKSGNKISHVLFPSPLVKDNTKAYKFKYTISLGKL